MNYLTAARSVVALLLALCGTTIAQPSGSDEIRIQGQIKPAFHVTPIAHKIEARRGAVVPIKFALESIDRATTIIVQPVALGQDVDGALVPDTQSPAPDNVKLLSPARVDFTDSQERTLRAEVRVPFSHSKFHSFGLLVTDLGRIVGTREVKKDNETRRVGIRFVTRYLLRCDVHVVGARGGDIRKVVMESAELAEEDGYAKARVWLNNPTDSPFEFQVRTRLAYPAEGTRQKAFNLCLPVRESSNPPKRHTVFIMPYSRVRVQEFLPEAVFPGEYELQVDLVSNHRTRLTKKFPISIKAGDFPAQDATIIQVARDITVEPSQLELSLQRGGKRFVSMAIKNGSKQTIKVDLTAESLGDVPVDWLTVRPTSVEIRPGRNRKVLVTLSPNQKPQSHQYAAIRVSAIPEEGRAFGQFQVPVALLSRSEEKPSIEFEQLVWDRLGVEPTFTASIANGGAMHMPINAALTLTNAFNQSFRLESGYGRWLLPSQSAALTFRPRFEVPPGQYKYKLEIGAEEEGASYVFEDKIDLD